MKEWKTYKLGDLINIQSGGTPNKAISAYWGGGIPWISAKTMYVDFITDSDLHITEEGLKNGSKLAPIGSILLLTRGSGLFNRIPVCLVKEPVAYNQDIKCITVKDGSITSNAFMFFWLYSQKELLSGILETTGIGAGKIDTCRLLDINVLLPDIETQSKFIQFCSSILEKIEVNKQINDNLEQQAQALYKSWFVDFEPFKDGEFFESEFGLIPEGWRVGALSDLTEITMGQSPSGKSYNETGDGMLFYQGRAEFGDRYPSIRLYTTEPSRIAEQNSVLLSVRAPVGDTNIAYNKCCIGRGLASIKAKHGFNSFIFYMVKSLKDQFDLYNGEGTVFGSINRDSLNSMKVIVPTNDVISDFEKIVAPLDFKYKSLFTENLLLTQQRDTLLPKLMSGELKINEIDC